MTINDFFIASKIFINFINFCQFNFCKYVNHFIFFNHDTISIFFNDFLFFELFVTLMFVKHFEFVVEN